VAVFRRTSSIKMGLCTRLDVEDAEAVRKSQKLLKLIAADGDALENKQKLLLLGAGESGKSTIFKQLRIINSTGYSPNELDQFCWIIHRNILDAVKILID